MKKIVLTFGLIAGLICGAMFFIMAPEDGKIDFEDGAVSGYITMVIALSTIFFAVKQYRDKYSNGVIKFKKAFLIGLYITIVAGVVYVLAWEIYYRTYGGDFVEQYVNYMSKKMRTEGKTKTEIEETLAPTIEMMDSYDKNIALRFLLTFIEIFPVGLIISVICGLIFGVFLKDKKNTEQVVS